MKKKLSLLFLSLILFSKTQSMTIDKAASLPSVGFIASFLCPILCVVCSAVGCMALEDSCCPQKKSNDGYYDQMFMEGNQTRDAQVKQAGYNTPVNASEKND